MKADRITKIVDIIGYFYISLLIAFLVALIVFAWLSEMPMLETIFSNIICLIGIIYILADLVIDW